MAPTAVDYEKALDVSGHASQAWSGDAAIRFDSQSSRAKGSDIDAQDDARLEALGYKRELKRVMGYYTNFGMAFTIVSILTGLTGLYTLGFTYGGPVVITWGWLVSVLFTCAVAASLAEICSAFPSAGGVYLYTYQLAGPKHRAFASWLAGWLNLTGEAAVTAGIVYTFATTLANVILIAMPPGSTFPAASPKMLLLYYGLTLLWAGVVNTCTVRVVSFLDGISVAWHCLGTVVFAIVLLAVAPTRQSGSYVFGAFNAAESSGVPGHAYVYLLGLLMSMFTLTGYDASGKMAEESRNAAKVAPFGIFMTVVISGVVGFIYLLAITFSIQDPSTLLDPANATGGTFVVGQVVLDAFMARSGSGNEAFARASAAALLCVPLVAQLFCSMSSVTGNSRTLWSFARDKAVPGHRWLARVSGISDTPVASTWVMVAAAFLLGLPMLGSTVAFAAITSLATIGLYISYAIPIFFRLVNGSNTFMPGPVHLGRAGVPVAVIALLWVAFLTVLFVLPTAYPVTHVNLNYAGVTVAGVLLVSIGWWVLSARKWFDGPNTV
ncbi:hypothetical protein OEZ86_006546 [Tetradesmus obliquus]|nr:hypothetical protein OEZ86_006546 [Tetradesmus obliquus]